MIRGIVDAAIIITVVEMAVLWAYGSAGSRSRRRSQVLNVAAGLCLMLALRVALTGADRFVIAACLILAAVAHGVYLHGRMRPDGR